MFWATARSLLGPRGDISQEAEMAPPAGRLGNLRPSNEMVRHDFMQLIIFLWSIPSLQLEGFS
jgi:hypothetical protein